jgi:RNA polymerase sigma factor (sigma-70 family)
MKEHATRRPSGVSAGKAQRHPAPPLEPPSVAETNSELVTRLRRGDRTAWLTLLDRYERLIYAVPRRSGLSAEDSADVFQDVLHAFLRSLPTLRNAEALPAWFMRTAFRYSMRRQETLSRQVRPESDAYFESIPDPRPDPSEVLANFQALAEVQQSIARLADPCRRLLTALFLEDPGASYAQVAQRLRVPIGSLGPTRRRCLDQLVDLLSEKRIRKPSGGTSTVVSRVSRSRSGGRS